MGTSFHTDWVHASLPGDTHALGSYCVKPLAQELEKQLFLPPTSKEVSGSHYVMSKVQRQVGALETEGPLVANSNTCGMLMKYNRSRKLKGMVSLLQADRMFHVYVCIAKSVSLREQCANGGEIQLVPTEVLAHGQD